MLTANYNYQETLAASVKANWRIEDIIGGDKHLDFTKPFMPESLARVEPLDFLSKEEKILLNQIRGYGYLYTFGVVVEFILRPRARPEEFVVRVLDEGEGFDPADIANPLDPENMLKSSGRGIFFMRNFMDDVSITRRPEGGMDVRMSKKLA